MGVKSVRVHFVKKNSGKNFTQNSALFDLSTFFGIENGMGGKFFERFEVENWGEKRAEI